MSVETIERRDRIYTYRWPIRTATTVELAALDAAGEPQSRIAAAARAQKRDAAKSGAAGGLTQMPSAPPKAGLREAIDGWLGGASWFKSSVLTSAEFLSFLRLDDVDSGSFASFSLWIGTDPMTGSPCERT